MSTKIIQDILWIEKYRPKKLEDMVLDSALFTRMKDVLENPVRMPHFLFIGTPGSGKTTLARILIDNIISDDSDLLIMNGSDKRGIEIFRSLIPEFLSVPPLISPVKIVFIDEGDNLTSDAKKIFRALLERYHSYSRFIITANDDTFTSAIKSRFEVIKFNKLEKNYLLNFCKNILDNEKIGYNENDIIHIINMFYPDTRKIVGTLQQNSSTGKLEISLIQVSNEDTLINMVIDIIRFVLDNKISEVNFKLIEISKFISSNYVDYIVVYKSLFEKLSYKCIPIKVLISRFMNLSVNSISPSMIFYEFIHEIRKSAEKLKGILNSEDIIEQ